jgi:hypothetical protein
MTRACVICGQVSKRVVCSPLCKQRRDRERYRQRMTDPINVELLQQREKQWEDRRRKMINNAKRKRRRLDVRLATQHLQVLLKFYKKPAKDAPEEVKEAHAFLSGRLRKWRRRRRADELAWAQIDAGSHKESLERLRA